MSPLFTGKVIVHEWGHLRWGLFNEYPESKDIADHFYISPTTESIEATRCDISIRGSHRLEGTDIPCGLNLTTSLPEDKCRFYPSSDTSYGTGSMMYYNYLPSVSFLDT